MKPRVLMIVLPYIINDGSTRSYHAFPYGVLSMVTYNKDLAEFKVLDLNNESLNYGNLCQVLEDFQPDIVGMTMMFDVSYVYLKDVLLIIRVNCPKCLTILGGAAASYSYEEILNEQPNLDAICYSEGEIPFRDLLSGKFSYIVDSASRMSLLHPSFVTKKTLEHKSIPKISYIENLDDVIDIDYSFVNPSTYDMQEAFSPFVDNKKHKQFSIVTSRGCPFECTFCSNGKMHGKKMRFASVDRIINHVRSLIDQYGMDVLTIYDDQLLIDIPRAKELFYQLTPFKLRIEMPNGLSPKFIDAEMAHQMKKAGVDTAYLAIESGSEDVLENLIHKPLKLSMVKPVVEWLRTEGIFCHGFFVMGMPGETHEHRMETERFIGDVDLDWAGLGMAMPLRGSQLYKDCVKNDWIPKIPIGESIGRKYIINIPGIDPKDVEDEVYQMNLRVNFHRNRRIRIGDYKTAARCFEEVIKRYEGHKVAKHYLQICRERIKEK